MPSATSACTKCRHKKCRRIVDRRRADERRGFRGNLTVTTTRDEPGSRFNVSRPVPDSATVTSRLSTTRPLALRAHLNDNRIAGGGACADDEIDRSFVVLECAHGRRVTRTAGCRASSRLRIRVVEEIVVADDAAFDPRDAGFAHLAREWSATFRACRSAR